MMIMTKYTAASPEAWLCRFMLPYWPIALLYASWATGLLMQHWVAC